MGTGTRPGNAAGAAEARVAATLDRSATQHRAPLHLTRQRQRTRHLPHRHPLTVTPETERIETRAGHRVRVAAGLVAVALSLWWVGRSLAPRLLTVVAHIQNLGPAAPIAFILIYAFAVVAFIP